VDEVGQGRWREHRCDTRDPPDKARQSEAHRSRGAMTRWLEATTWRRWTLVVGGELRWVLQLEGGTGSEEGPMAEDDDGRRWELTMRGLKRR
jgi:hypothetical protein